MALMIRAVRVHDVRYPTSDSLKGSDPFHKKPDYSGVYIEIETDKPDLTGRALVFMIGAGTDWVAYGARDLASLLVGVDAEPLISDLGKFHRRLFDHHQLRWLGGGGVFSMAVGGIVNAMWDLAAKTQKMPMWRFLCSLRPEAVVDAINWRHISDVLTPEEALQRLRNTRGVASRMTEYEYTGPEAYSTAAWSGLSDDEVRRACLHATGTLRMRSVKAKVGTDLADDKRRLALIRKAVGSKVGIRVDANQFWGVDKAITWMKALAEFEPIWIEEPTHPDDVPGYRKIGQAVRPLGIGTAGGEHVMNPVIFKGLMSTGQLDYCQIDATRMSGVNDVLAVILMAWKLGVPVCPHGGGIGLCNLIQHYGAWDQIVVGRKREKRVVEWIDFLDEAMVHPVQIREGHYVLPSVEGWGVELQPDFVAKYAYPNGPFWRDRVETLKGVRFEA